MSYSWACVGEFTIPSERIDALKQVEEAWLTDLDDIREDAALTDTIYEGTTMRYRSIFEKSSYADKVEVIEELLETLIAHGGEGTLRIVGFDDGGPDAGDSFVVKNGVVSRSEFESADVADEVRRHRDYLAMRERFFQAFGGDD